MVPENSAPETPLEAVKYFADKDAALAFVAAIRWPDGVTCPNCDDKSVTFLSTRRLWKCRACQKQFSIKAGSIFEDSPIGLDKWLPAMWLLVNYKNCISSYGIARDLKVTQKTAWFMLHRLRLAMQAKSFQKFDGEVDADETYIGGKARNMHAKKRKPLGMKNGRSGIGKVAVMGLLERHSAGSRVHLQILKGTRKSELQAIVRGHVEPGAAVYSDALKSYTGLNVDYIHGVIDHAEQYVDGQIHTNGQNFWSLLKRALKGTYVSVEPFHLFRYLDEQAFRFNERKLTDAVRFVPVLSSVFGRRLTYKALTGKLQTERA